LPPFTLTLHTYKEAGKLLYISSNKRGRRGRDRMVVGFTTTYVISACHH